MAKPAWTPWHKVVQLRDDLRTGALALHEFAADLDDVARKAGKRKVYEDPAEFFALTYPTTNLRNLAKDVCGRLAGKNTKAIRQLELTYGGGKTHTLITLYHLAGAPESLPALPAVEEFRQQIGLDPLPKARVVVLPFDKLDVEKGMEVRGPSGKLRWLRHPWSVLAWQIAEEEGLRLLHADSKPEERDTPPATNLLTDLLALPGKEGLGTLVLLDEVLMYAREKVRLGKEWRGMLQSFFQGLCQATTKVDRAALVASLLATDPAKSDTEGQAVLRDIQDVFSREKEEGVQPVLKEDVAEVLRRRFFTPQSLAQREPFRQHVIAALQGMQDLDGDFKKKLKEEEERFFASYPFHPDLTEVLYTKWTQLGSFQRTRGVLRTFAIALRDAEAWDEAPLVGLNVLLPKPGLDGVSEASRELTSVAALEKEEGTGHNWSFILEGELSKARDAQADLPALGQREIEQAVLTVFVHSQPIGQKANLNELFRLLGATRPDRISLEKGLKAWLETSWFLDEGADPEKKAGGTDSLPKVWRLGTRPNLNQMHSVACGRILPGDVETRLENEIRGAKALTSGANPAGAIPHMLPSKPADVGDDGDFHYAVLGPAAASESGKPSPEAKRFLEENTGPNNPRKERNAVVLAVPSRDGLDNARLAVRRVLGWEEVRRELQGHELDSIRQARLESAARADGQRLRDAVAQAYSIVVTVGKDDTIQAFKVTPSDTSLFSAIAQDPRARILSEEINAEAILPGGPYDLWREDEDSRRVSDIVGAFARFPRLPKMLRRDAILATIASGIREGQFVGRLTRPDHSVRTFWRESVEIPLLAEPGFELVLPAKAQLERISPDLLAPAALPGLWSAESLPLAALRSFFSGSATVPIDRGGYVEQIPVPKVSEEALRRALGEAVLSGRVWLLSGPISVFREEIPPGVLTDSALLRRPPEPIGAFDLLPDHLPAAWSDGKASAKVLYANLATRRGLPVPWSVFADGLSRAIKNRLVSVVPGTGSWPCTEEKAGALVLQAGEPGAVEPMVAEATELAARGQLESHQLQDLADQAGALIAVADEAPVTFEVTLKVPRPKSEAESEALLRRLNEILEKAAVPLKFQ